MVKPKLGAAVHTNIPSSAMYRHHPNLAFEIWGTQIFGLKFFSSLLMLSAVVCSIREMHFFIIGLLPFSSSR
jgi:hypothetical protein